MKNTRQKKNRIARVLLTLAFFAIANIAGLMLVGCQSTGGAGYTADKTEQEKKREREKERERREFQREVIEDALDSF